MHWRQVPPGERDVLPADQFRRLAAVAALRDEFASWGYREVATPTLEYLDTFVRGGGLGTTDGLFKIVDRGGELLVLRPELTVPIARLAATRLPADPGVPLRLSYVAPVFRGQSAGRGKMREFTQAGIELIGAAGADADAEVIALALSALRRAGATGVVAHVGHLGLVSEWLEALPEDERETVRARLYRREFVEFDGEVADRELSALLRILPDLHGPSALDRAGQFAVSPQSRAALDELAALLDRLAEYGFAESVEVDFSIIRDFSYYTGMVVEAYGPGAGSPLLGGGRYDTLLGRFGPDRPATGFALGLDQILDTIPGAAVPAVDLVLAGSTDHAGLVRLAMRLRGAGVRVLLAAGTGWDEGLALARQTPATWLAVASGTGIHLYEVASARGMSTTADDMASEILDNRREAAAWTP